MLDMLEFLRDEGVSADITAEIEKFRDAYPEEDETLRRRVPDPRYLYYGKTSGRRPSPPSSAERTCCW